MRTKKKLRRVGPFQRWLRKQNAEELSRTLRVTRQTVYIWLHAGGLPRPSTLRKLLKLGAGEFTALDVVQETYLVQY